MRDPARRRGREAARILLLALAPLGCLVLAAPAQDLPPRCFALTRPDPRGRFVARADLVRAASAIDADDLLVLVNRTPTGSLPHAYAPRDLVDLATMRPARPVECVPPRMQCLRDEAARAYQRLEAAMRAEGLRPLVFSAFRDYQVQCATLLNWAGRSRGGVCSALSASALPGHSHHQLGTTLDLFDRAWTDPRGNRFREGFGCSPAGLWIAAHAHEHGFVIPYPLHPDYRRDTRACAALPGAEARLDPRTGYRYEPWHLRYVGTENAARYHAAWLASVPGSEAEITLEQWLRAERAQAVDSLYAPVCDGCNCDRCATFVTRAEDTPCERPPLRLDEDGEPMPAAGAPELLGAHLERAGPRLVLHARVQVPENTLTQPPIATPASGAFFARGSRVVRLAQGPRAFADLGGTWRLAVGFGESEGEWPWKAALAAARDDGLANGLNARMPAAPGELALALVMEGVAPGTFVRVALASGDDIRGALGLIAP